MDKIIETLGSQEQVVDRNLRGVLERVSAERWDNSFICQDVTTMLTKIGVPDFARNQIVAQTMELLSNFKYGGISLEQLERNLNHVLYKQVETETGEPKKSVIELLPEALTGRAKIIFNQVQADMEKSGGKMLDFGAGDGQVTQMLRDAGNDIEGFDVVLYKQTAGLVYQFDGSVVPREDHTYDTLLATNVFHHEANNHICLEECYRLLKPGGTMVVIETIPVVEEGETKEEAWDRCYFNDWFYNRPFHPVDNIPVPGTYETEQGWKDRFQALGLQVMVEYEHGIDIDIVPDHHHQFVLLKPDTASSKVKKVLKDA